MRVNYCLEQRVIARALLAHVVEKSVGGACVCISANANERRDYVAGAEAIVAHPLNRAKVQPICGEARPERLGSQRLPFENGGPAFIAYDERGKLTFFQRAENGNFGRVGQISELIDADDGVGLRSNTDLQQKEDRFRNHVEESEIKWWG